MGMHHEQDAGDHSDAYVPLAPCGFKLHGFMPPCVLSPGHEGDHEDGFGGYYGNLTERGAK